LHRRRPISGKSDHRFDASDVYFETKRTFWFGRVMRNLFALFLVTAIAVLGQEPYRNSASAQQSQPPGAEAELIVSHLVALGIDCSFKINTSELQKLVGLKGFKIEDFRPNGKFSERMEEQIVSARELIKNKGCTIARDIILNDLPDIGG
jgi:hypothetical protein